MFIIKAKVLFLLSALSLTAIAKDTRLHTAARKGDTKKVKELMSLTANEIPFSKFLFRLTMFNPDPIIDINAKNGAGMTAFHIAAYEGHIETIRELIRLGANIHIRTEYLEQTAFHLAASQGHTETVRELARLGVDIHAKGRNNWTAIHYAARGGHTETVRELARLGVDIHAKDVDARGRPAIHFAARGGHTETVRELKRLGADTAAIAKSDPNFDLARQAMEEFERSGTNQDMIKALHSAAKIGDIKTITRLVKLGADINIKDEIFGRTALLHYAWGGHTETLRELIRLGADIHAKDHFGKTALHLAADRGHTETVRELARLGADIHAQDKDGRTALDLAKQWDYTETIRALNELYRTYNMACRDTIRGQI